MKILVAEDGKISRKIIEMMLKEWAYEVISACDGTEAWEKLNAPDAPKLALLDWEMPGIDGAEICRRARRSENLKSTYIILLTARGTKDNIVEGLNAGADDYMQKPFDSDELRARLGAGIRIINLQTALDMRVKELWEAIDHVKQLQGILPICMYCHKIRDDCQSWQQLEHYITEHSEANFSHSLCPECLEKKYPE